MSADQTRRTLNQLDSELADLEKKLAEWSKKEADFTKRINDTQKSITKNTSSSLMQSKLGQIQRNNDELAKVVASKADINKKIAERRKKRTDTAVRLQKEEADEATKASRAQKKIYNAYEERISELTSQIERTVTTPQRLPKHLYNETESIEEYDVFISYASEDKRFTDELNHILSDEYGIKVWYDEISITWGDSLRSKIDSGIKKSKFGIVVISKSYIKKGWTQYELDGLFQIEMTKGKTILPVWHDITKDEVQNFSPTLAGKKAFNTAMFSTREIAVELRKLLGIESALLDDRGSTEEDLN